MFNLHPKIGFGDTGFGEIGFGKIGGHQSLYVHRASEAE
jgi:hypothetical protein